MNPRRERFARLQPRRFAICAVLLGGAGLQAASLPIGNPSFEEADGHQPRGWRFRGDTAAHADAWTTNQVIAGTRAIRLDARFGSVQWESLATPAPAGRRYLLRWQARFSGEKSWRFRADFSGVQVFFHDAAGRLLGSARQHTSCWQTPGWRPGWLLFSTPRKTSALTLGFALQASERLPGGFDVDAVELEEWPPSAAPADSNACVLVLKVLDEQGRPVAARVRIASAQGDPVRPPGTIVYDQAGGAFHPLEEGICHALMPHGTYMITITRGFEYEPWQHRVEATATTRTVTARLQRNWNWGRHGWFSADHHTHLFRHGGSMFPSLRWPDALRAARAEGLDFLPFMGADRYPVESESGRELLSSRDFGYELTEEITEDFWGHVCPLGVTPEARRDPRYDAGPMNFDRYAAIAPTGGAFTYGHPCGPLGEGDELTAVAQLGRGHVAREFPVDLALGVPCAMDLLAMEGDRNQLERKLRDLYRLWNLGFRPGVAAATDFHVDQGRQPIGAARTYVRAEMLDPQGVAAAYRHGRTFATSGPLLDLSVAGQGPGDELRLPKPGKQLRTKIEAASIGGLDHVELVVNGQVFRRFAADGRHQITSTCDVPANHSFWIAARAYGPENRHLASALEGRSLGAGQFAHTSPVYVVVQGQPIQAGTAADADYFVRWCDAVLAGWRRHVTANPDQGRHDPLVTERLARAREVFSSLGVR